MGDERKQWCTTGGGTFAVSSSNMCQAGNSNFGGVWTTSLPAVLHCSCLQGYYCLTLKLTIVAGSGRMGGYIPVPPYDLHSMTQVHTASQAAHSCAAHTSSQAVQPSWSMAGVRFQAPPQLEAAFATCISAAGGI